MLSKKDLPLMGLAEDIRNVEGCEVNEKKYKTLKKVRMKRSIFCRGIKNLNDNSLRALVYCLLIDKNVKGLIDCYSKAVDNTLHHEALQEEVIKRNINIGEMLRLTSPKAEEVREG